MRRPVGRASADSSGPLGPYISDFCCDAARLVLELGGPSHDDPEADQRRDEWVTARNWTVLRVGNDDVVESPDGVVERIGDSLSEAK